ncbi:MAG: Tat pathway signal protein [Phenylobacterium sp.]
MHRRVLLALFLLLGATQAPAAEAPAEGKIKVLPRFMTLGVLNANFIRSNTSRGVISVECGLDVPDPKLRDRVQLLAPRLRANLTRSLLLYASDLPPGRAPNLEVLTPLLQRQVDRTAGQAGARLLITNVLIN